MRKTPRGAVLALLLLLSGCATGSYFRTARTLETGKYEVGGGIALNPWLQTGAVYGAYGFRDRFELEARLETYYASFTPRYQIFAADWGSPVDLLVFLELGAGSGLYAGPGLAVGRRFGFFEPYLSYRVRVPWAIHYLKAGARFHLSSRVFISAEAGVLIYSGTGTWGVNDFKGSATYDKILPEGGISVGMFF